MPSRPGPELNGKLVVGVSADWQIVLPSGDLDWLNKGVFISVGGPRQGGVVYETYLVA
jgi:hypothetical protein